MLRQDCPLLKFGPRAAPLLGPFFREGGSSISKGGTFENCGPISKGGQRLFGFSPGRAEELTPHPTPLFSGGSISKGGNLLESCSTSKGDIRCTVRANAQLTPSTGVAITKQGNLLILLDDFGF